MSFHIQKLNFKVIACTGHDEDFPPESLTMHHSALAKGWQSERFCMYPQAMIIQLEHGFCHLQKIQILSHHFKISKKIEIFIGQYQSNESMDDIQFKRLGYIELNNNQENNFKVRELKSIHLDTQGTHVKFVFHKCHVNALNLYNQIGIVGMSILGQIMDTDYIIRNATKKKAEIYGLTHPEDRDDVLNGFVNQDAIDRRIQLIHDLGYDLSHDPEIIQFMSLISFAKEHAIKRENYSLAKALKILFESSQEAAHLISDIQIQKDIQVHHENYDQAEQLKLDIEHIKSNLKVRMNQLGLELRGDGHIHPIGSESYDSKIDLHQSMVSLTASLHSLASKESTSHEQFNSQSLNHLKENTLNHPQDIPTNPPMDLNAKPNQSINQQENLAMQPQDMETLKKPTISSPVIQPQKPVDEIPLKPPTSPPLPAQQAKQQINPMEIPLKSPKSPPLPAQQLKPAANPMEIPLKKPSELNLPVNPEIPTIQENSNQIKSLINEPLPDGLEQPEPMTIELQAKYSHSIDVFGLTLVQCALSIKFKNREWALGEIMNRLHQWERKSESLNRIQPRKTQAEKRLKKTEAPQNLTITQGNDWIEQTPLQLLCKATMDLIVVCIDDTREKTTDLTLKAWDQLLNCIERFDPENLVIFKYSLEAYHSLIARAGDSNPRVKSASKDLLKKFTRIYHDTPTSILSECIQPFQKRKGAPVHPKIIKSRLETLRNGILDYGIHSSVGLSTMSILAFVLPLIEHQSNEVRELAYEISAMAGSQASPEEFDAQTSKLTESQKSQIQSKMNALPATGKLQKNKKQQKSQVQESKPIIKETKSSRDSSAKTRVKREQKHAEDSDKLERKQGKKSVKKQKDSKVAKGEKSEKAHQKTQECIFCHQVNDEFDESGLESHYSKECPFLTSCPQCQLASFDFLHYENLNEKLVEIPTLYNHLHKSCELAPSNEEQCQKCHEFIQREKLSSHKKKCKGKMLTALKFIKKTESYQEICALCQQHLKSPNAWKEHLLMKCPNHPRKPKDTND